MSEVETGTGKAPEAAGNGSRAQAASRAGSEGLRRGLGPRFVAVLVLSAGAAAALLITELTTLIEIDVASGSCLLIQETNPTLADQCITTGGERHGFGLLAIALLVLAMGWGAARGRSRPAAAALVVAGLVVLGIWGLADLPDIYDEGLIGRDYDRAEASPGPAFWLELAGGAGAIAAGLAALTLGPGRPRRG